MMLNRPMVTKMNAGHGMFDSKNSQAYHVPACRPGLSSSAILRS